MTVPCDFRPPARRFAFRWARFVAVALVLSAIGIMSVDGLQPEFRMQTVETVAEIQIRVVPQIAPTSEALEKRILGSEYLTAVWKDSLPDDADSSSEVRDAELAEWRHRLRVVLGSEESRSLRSIRVIWSGLDEMELGALVVESLARRYADEVSADRWYGSVDRLRSKVKAYERSTQELLNVARRSAEQSRSVSAVESVPEVGHEPSADSSAKLDRVELLSTTMRADTPQRNPLDDRYRELVERRARLAATMQPNHPELQAVDVALAAAASELRNAPTVVLTAATETEHDSHDGPSLLLAPEAASPMKNPVPKKPISAVARKPIASQVVASPELDESTRRVNAASSELQTQMDDMLLPREAEFPVITLDRVGLQVWHLRPIWYAGVVLLSILLAAAVSVTTRGDTAEEVQREATPLAPARQSPVPKPTDVPSEHHTTVVASTSTSHETEAPSDSCFRNAAEVEARLAAPVLAVLTRRSSTTVGDVQSTMRRAA